MKMKYILIIIMLSLTLFSCGKKNDTKKIISANSITDSLKCDECGSNLRKYISTNHAVELSNGNVKHYCTLNCLVKDWKNIKDKTENIYVIDVKEKEFIPVNEAHYVIRAPFGKKKKNNGVCL